jgi:hypothetical protein
LTRHLPRRFGAYPSGIDDENDEFNELSEIPEEDDSLEIHPDPFKVTTGFLRAGDEERVPPPAEDGPEWTYDEADREAHLFLRSVAGGREAGEFHTNPVEHARLSGLMILFSEDVQESFETYLARMPDPRAEAWRDLIAGGASSEAFGPLTLEEKLDAEQVDEALQQGRKQRTVNLALSAVVLAVMLAGGVYLYSEVFASDERTEGAFQFDALGQTPEVAALTGGPPVAEPALTAALTTTVAVAAGDGPEAERITVAPFSVYPYPPGAIRASLFQYAGSGHVVFVGPDGFVDDVCLRASVVTSDLRPLDTVTFGSCQQPVGREPSVGCIGSSAVLLDLVVPSGEVALPEGGSGFADQVRVQLIGDDAAYEVLSLRGTIEVSADDAVTVPSFGGEVGDELTFDLSADRIGTCTITGDLPRRS